MSQRFYDMHTHSLYSHDSTCPIEEMAEAQLAKGTLGFAVTDHCGGVDKMDVDEAFHSIRKASEKYAGKIKIFSGLEIGEAIWNLPHAKELSEKFAYDVIIGSVHAVRYTGMNESYSQIDFTDIPESEIFGFMSQYFDDVYQTADVFSFDILAHLTCPLRYINGKYGRNFDVHVFEDKITNILKCIIDKNIALEINTSGIGTSFDSFMPEEWIIEKYKNMGGFLITLGSDAHVSKNATNGFEKAAQMLRQLGFTHCYYYKNRKPVAYEI